MPSSGHYWPLTCAIDHWKSQKDDKLINSSHFLVNFILLLSGLSERPDQNGQDKPKIIDLEKLFGDIPKHLEHPSGRDTEKSQSSPCIEINEFSKRF